MDDVDRVDVDLAVLTVPIARRSSDAGNANPGGSSANLSQAQPSNCLGGVRIVKRRIGCVTVEGRHTAAA